MSTVVPVTRKLSIYREADFVETLQWLHDGSPVDLNGATIEGAIRRTYADASPAVAFTCALLNANQGLFEIALNETQTDGLAFDAGVYDVRVTRGSLTERVMQGVVKVYPSAT